MSRSDIESRARITEEPSSDPTSSPGRKRAALLEGLLASLRADVAVFFNLFELPPGLQFGALEIHDPSLSREARTSGAAELAGRMDPGDRIVAGPFRGGPPRWVCETTSLYPAFARLFAQRPMHHIIRLAVYDANRLAGWVGLLRTRERGSFTLRERRRLNAWTARVYELVLDTDAAERARTPRRGGELVLSAETGEVQCASEAGMAWRKVPRFTQLLRETVARTGAMDLTESEAIVGRAAVRLTRLRGDHGTHYLVRVSPAVPAAIVPDSTLSDRQREVARCAAAGATVPEIASALQLSVGTVHSHLREVYRRLEVSSRVELAEVLLRGGARPPAG